jgi:hypothetical protein
MSQTTYPAETPCRLYVVYYALHEQMHVLAQAIQRGATCVPDVETKLFQMTASPSHQGECGVFVPSLQ